MYFCILASTPVSKHKQCKGKETERRASVCMYWMHISVMNEPHKCLYEYDYFLWLIQFHTLNVL